MRSASNRASFLFSFILFISTFSGAILAANKPEFLLSRFPDLTPIMYSLFDVSAYLSYFVGIILGILSDLKKERKLFIVMGASGSVVGLYLLTFVQNYSLLLLIRFIEGIFSIMIWQSLMVLNLDYSDETNRGKNMGILGISLGSAMAFGSMAGGFIAFNGINMPYYVAMILRGLVCIISLWKVKNPQQISNRPSLKESILLLKTQPRLIVPGIFNLVDRLHMGFIVLIIPLFIVEVFGMDTGFRGMMLGILNIPALLMMYPVGKKSDAGWGRFRPLIIGSLGYGISLSLTGILGQLSIGVFIGLLLFQGMFSGFTTAPASALVGDLVEEKNNGMGIALFNFLGNIGIVLGPIIGGIIVEFFGFAWAFIVAGLIELISLSINVILAKLMKFISL
jgi:ACDE family multidrug resistance protein